MLHFFVCLLCEFCALQPSWDLLWVAFIMLWWFGATVVAQCPGLHENLKTLQPAWGEPSKFFLGQSWEFVPTIYQNLPKPLKGPKKGQNSKIFVWTNWVFSQLKGRGWGPPVGPNSQLWLKIKRCTDFKGSFLKPKHVQPVNSWDSIMGAISGPCSGHLALSHVRLVEASAVGQLNSSPSLWQAWAESPW